jgi:hypothetical protein
MRAEETGTPATCSRCFTGCKDRRRYSLVESESGREGTALFSAVTDTLYPCLQSTDILFEFVGSGHGRSRRRCLIVSWQPGRALCHRHIYSFAVIFRDVGKRSKTLGLNAWPVGFHYAA